MGVMKKIDTSAIQRSNIFDTTYIQSDAETASVSSWDGTSAASSMHSVPIPKKKHTHRNSFVRTAGRRRNVGGAWHGLQEARLSAGPGAGAPGARSQRRRDNDSFLRQLASVGDFEDSDFTGFIAKETPLSRLCQGEAGLNALDSFVYTIEEENEGFQEVQTEREQSEMTSDQGWARVSTPCKLLLKKRATVWSVLQPIEEELRLHFGGQTSGEWCRTEEGSFCEEWSMKRMLIHAVAQYLGLESQSRPGSTGHRHVAVHLCKFKLFKPPAVSLNEYLNNVQF